MPRVATASPNDINKIHPTPSKNKKYVRHHRHMIKYVLSKIKYEKPFSRVLAPPWCWGEDGFRADDAAGIAYRRERQALSGRR